MDVITIDDDVDLFLLAIEFYRINSKLFDNMNSLELNLLYEFSRKWCLDELENQLCDYQARFYLDKSKNTRYNKYGRIIDLQIVELDIIIDIHDARNQLLLTIPKFDHTTFRCKYTDGFVPSIKGSPRYEYEVDCKAIVDGTEQPIIIPDQLDFIGLSKKYLVMRDEDYLMYRNNTTFEWRIIQMSQDMEALLMYHKIPVGTSKEPMEIIDDYFDTFLVHNDIIMISTKRSNMLSVYNPVKKRWAHSIHILVEEMHHTNDSVIFLGDNVWMKISFNEFYQMECANPQYRRSNLDFLKYRITDTHRQELLKQKID
jgi:hypothetical protein